MPTILTHPAVPLALGLGLGRKTISGRLLACGMLGAILPDLDVLAFHFHIPYAAALGHRGFSHSLLFALCVAAVGTCGYRWLKSDALATFLFLFVAVASHGILDTITNGGLGIALLWPWSEHRYFAPFQPLEVSPIGLRPFLSARGLAVIKSELLWVWLPALGVCVTLTLMRLTRRFGATKRRRTA